MGSARDVLVIGLGVSGLSCAIRLAEAGFRVRVVGERAPLDSTSAVAGAVWYPYRAGPPDRVRAWGRATLLELARLAGEAGTGVFWVDGVEVLPRHVPPPEWAGDVPGFRRATASELPPGCAQGYAFRVPALEMDVYLPYLVRRLEQLGGSLGQGRFDDLGQALARCPLVVDCAGLGARELARDASLFPIRGQLVRVARGSNDRFLLEEGRGGRFAYVLPRSRDVVLGGTADDGRSDLEPVAEESAGILARCARLCPELARARRLGERVGLRPGRPRVRLELERRPEGRGGGAVVHDYGHGGAGVTLSWGCAEEVCGLVLAEARAMTALG